MESYGELRVYKGPRLTRRNQLSSVPDPVNNLAPALPAAIEDPVKTTPKTPAICERRPPHLLQRPEGSRGSSARRRKPEMADLSIWRRPEGQTLEEFLSRSAKVMKKMMSHTTSSTASEESHPARTESDLDHCCSFNKDIRKDETLEGAVPCNPSPPTSSLTEDIQVAMWDYKQPQPLQPAIVTFDVELIGPEETRWHPAPMDSASQPLLYERRPWGICVNSKTEQIYVADRAYHDVLVFGADGEFQYHIGRGVLHRPIAVACDPAGDRLFVVDKDNHRIQVFSATTNQLLFGFGESGVLPGQLSFPWGIAVSRDGNYVAVADSRNRRIQLFTSDGEYLRGFGAQPNTPKDKRNKNIFHSPRGIAFDPTGRVIYVTDFNHHCLYRLDIDFTQMEILVGDKELLRPSGIDVDAAGNIILCDARHNSVKVFSPNGQLVRRMNSIGGDLFDRPLDLASIPSGYLAVMDFNGRVRIFKL